MTNTGTSKTRHKKISFSDCLSLTSFLLSQEAILGVDNSVSIIKMYDDLRIESGTKPPFLPPLNLTIEFKRKKNITPETFNLLGLSYRVTMFNPEGKETEICIFDVEQVKHPWTYARTVLCLTGYAGFKSLGEYTFAIYGKTTDTEFTLLGERVLPVIEEPQEESLTEQDTET